MLKELKSCFLIQKSLIRWREGKDPPDLFLRSHVADPASFFKILSEQVDKDLRDYFLRREVVLTIRSKDVLCTFSQSPCSIFYFIANISNELVIFLLPWF